MKLKKVVPIALLIFFASAPIYAMHIMEGYLPLMHCVLWGVLCLPFLFKGMKNLGTLRRDNPRIITVLAMAGAYAFVLSALKIPSVTGSSSHPTGTGLASILFGPSITSIIALIVLLFQAILLAHGGLTTIGANTFSMGIVGPLVSYGIYKAGMSAKMNKGVVVFLAAGLGNLSTYCITSLQLAIAHPGAGGIMESVIKFGTVFAVTQIPLAIIEGLLTVVVVVGLESLAEPELKSIGFLGEA